MTKTSTLKKSTELSTRLAQERATETNANAEHAQLVAQSASIVCEGVDEMRRHGSLIQDAADRAVVAHARAEKLSGQLAEAQDREAEDERQERYDALTKVLKGRREKFFSTLESLYPKILDALGDGKATQDEIDAINKNLPQGATPIEHLEASMRHVPAVPDHQVVEKVQRPVQDGHPIRLSVGDQPRMQTVQETRTIRGTRARRPAPLWEAIELPPLDCSTVMLRVPGTRMPMDFMIFGT